jgi:hypothetical protein
MKRNYYRIAGVMASAFIVWEATLQSALGANSPALVVFSCMETNPATGYTVVSYDASPSAPAKPSTDCATTLETLLNDGFTNTPNVSLQTYTASAGAGAPNGTNGTYITYVLSLKQTQTQRFPWLPAVLSLLLQ